MGNKQSKGKARVLQDDMVTELSGVATSTLFPEEAPGQDTNLGPLVPCRGPIPHSLLSLG